MEALRGFLERATGPMSPQQLASAVFGLYAGCVYLTPLFGGLLADRLLGRTKTVVIGASLMALGHFLMAFEASFLVAIACLLLGVGCFKGNIAAAGGRPLRARRQAAGERLPDLHPRGADRGDRRAHRLRHARREGGWHWGFGAAGVGMVIGLGVYLAGRRWLPPEPALGAAAKKARRAAHRR